MPQIELALEGKVDFIRKTNPWGGASDDSPARTQAQTQSGRPPDKARVSQNLAAFLRGMAAQQRRR